MSKLRAAAYCRVSSNKNIQLHSLEAQKIQCCECGRNYRRIKTRKGEIIWRCAGQVERTSGCQSRTIKQSEIDEYTRSILQIYKETIDTKSLIEKIVVDKNAFKIIVDSTVLS